MIESLRGELRQLEELEKNPAFLNVVGMIQASIDEMQRMLVLQPASSIDSCLGQEYRKGQIEGRIALVQAIADRKDHLNYEIDKQKQEMSDETEV